jgi:hypothetical protein
MSKRLDTNTFIRRSREKHNDFYDYSESSYINSETKLTVICPYHGEFTPWPLAHIKGSGCPECGLIKNTKARTKTTEQFVSEAIAKHGNKYDYSLVQFNSVKDKVKIACPLHGVFEQEASAHLHSSQGCPKCGRIKAKNSRRLKDAEFIRRSVEAHSNRYDYSCSRYTGKGYNIEIICKEHGSFWQLPANHWRGANCPKCGDIKKAEYNSNNPSGWGVTNWIKKASNSKCFDSFKIYLIVLYFDNNEHFLKVGRTFNEVSRRYKSSKYNYRLIHSVSGSAKFIYDSETLIRRKFKPYKIVPSIEFGGMQECFNIGILDELIAEFENLKPDNHD